MRDRRPPILFGHHDDSFNYPRASFSSSSELRAVIIIWRLPSRHLACPSPSPFRPTLPTPSCRDSLRLPVQHRDSGVKADDYRRESIGWTRPSMTIYFDCPPPTFLPGWLGVRSHGRELRVSRGVNTACLSKCLRNARRGLLRELARRRYDPAAPPATRNAVIRSIDGTNENK